MRDLQKAKFKDHATLVRWCAEADSEIKRLQALVEELENSIDEAWGSANAGQTQCYNCATTFLALDAAAQEKALYHQEAE